MTWFSPCMDWRPAAVVSVAGYWQLVSDTCNMNKYERDMYMYKLYTLNLLKSAGVIKSDTKRFKRI